MVCQGKVNSVAMMRKETELIDRDHQLEPRWEPLEPRWEPLEPRWEPLEPRWEPLELRWKSLEYQLQKAVMWRFLQTLRMSLRIHWESRDSDDDGFKGLGAEYSGMLPPNCSRVGRAETRPWKGTMKDAWELVKSLGSIKEQLALHAHAGNGDG